MVKLTKAQRAAVFKVWVRTVEDTDAFKLEVHRSRCSMRQPEFRLRSSLALSISYRRFRKTVQPLFFGDGCVMVKFSNMWLGIERDGYTHS